jgi:glycosyltransferase EpsF
MSSDGKDRGPEHPRILQVLSGMGRGGIETWLMNVFRYSAANSRKLVFDFLVEATGPRAYDAEIAALGGQIHRSPPFRNRLAASLRLWDLLRHHDYAAVHVHGAHDAGWPLSAAASAGVSRRLAHVHSVRTHHRSTLLAHTYRIVLTRATVAMSTAVLGCSRNALASLVGSPTPRGKCAVLHYGIDVSRFSPRPRAHARQTLGISPNNRVLVHTGRFVTVKNQSFVLRLLQAKREAWRDWVVLFVGDGPDRQSVEKEAIERGVSSQVRFCGEQPEVESYLSAGDVFVLPSLYEGLGLAAIEAQAMGLPCVVSTGVPLDVAVAPWAVAHVPLSEPSSWHQALEAAVEQSNPANARDMHDAVLASDFEIGKSVSRLRAYYGLPTE